MVKTYITKPLLPPISDYVKYLEKIWDNSILTNNGPLVQELERKISDFLQVEDFIYLSNGTLSLQLALSALDISEGEIITTPFSYVATISSVLWQRCKPVFVDIETENFTIDPSKIEEKINKNTKAILGVHVFGYPCDIEKIQEIADKYSLKVIYDAAHTFGVKYKGKHLSSYGDISTLSFHATKVFQTVEGGGCVIKDKAISKKLELQRRFGHSCDTHYCLGINAKVSEFHAAMGLATLPQLESRIVRCKEISKLYDNKLGNVVKVPKKQKELEYNYSYYPVVFPSEKRLLHVIKKLNKQDIYPRRYFYPSLNTLPYVEYESCKLSEDITKKILCLPLYPQLEEEVILKICDSVIYE